MTPSYVRRAGILALLVLMSTASAQAAAKVELFDDGPNGPLRSCIVQPGLWMVTFERDYANLASTPESTTAATSILDGSVTLVIKCDGTTKVSFPNSSVEFITAATAKVAGKEIAQPSGDTTFPIVFGQASVSTSPDDGNPVVNIAVDLGGMGGQQVWTWHVTKNEGPDPDTRNWLSGHEPWNGKSPAAANPNAPAVNGGGSVGNYHRLDAQSIYVAATLETKRKVMSRFV